MLLFFLFPLGQLEKLPLNIPGVSIYLHDLVLAGIWITLLLNCQIAKLLKDKFTKKFLLFTGIAFLAWIINLPRWGPSVGGLTGLMYLVRWIGLFGIYLLIKSLSSKFLISNSEFLNKSQIQNSEFINHNSYLINLLKLSVFATAIFGVVQYLLFPDLRYLRYFGWDDHYFRMTGTFLDPNFFGLIMVIGLGLELLAGSHPEAGKSAEGSPPATLYVAMRAGRSKTVDASLDSSVASPFRNDTKTNWLRVIFYLFCLALTYSRASWVAWLILLVSWTISRIFCEPIKFDPFYLLRVLFRPLKLLTTCFLLLATFLIFYFVPKPYGEGGNLLRTASVVARENNWSQSWQIIKENPVFGVGFNNYQLASPNHTKADNSLLLVWATTGIFGFAAFVWLIFRIQPFWLILPIVIHSFFNNSLFYPWVMILVWAIGGAGDLSKK